MRSNEAPQLQAHLIQPASGSDYAKQKAVEEDHVQGSNSCSDAHGESHERNRQIVGHDGAAGDWLHGDDRMCPHLVMFDCVHHRRTKHLKLKIRVIESREQTRYTSSHEDDECDEHITEISLEYFGKRSRKEAQGIKSTATSANVNGIVNAGEELVQMPGIMLGALVLAQDREIGSDLTIQEAQAAKFAPVESLNA